MQMEPSDEENSIQQLQGESNSSQLFTIERERAMTRIEEEEQQPNPLLDNVVAEKHELCYDFDVGTANECKRLVENDAMADAETSNFSEEMKLGFTIVEEDEDEDVETREIVGERCLVAEEKEAKSEDDDDAAGEKEVQAEEVVMAEESDVEAQDDQGEREHVNQSTNRDEETYHVKEVTPLHGEEAQMLREKDDVIIIDVDESDAENEHEKTENDGEEECNEDNENGEPTTIGGGDDITGVKKGEDKERDDEKTEDSDDGNEDCINDNVDERHLSDYICHSLSLKKETVLELYVGGLDKAAVEDDLIKIFAKFGEIKEVRIVRNSHKKSKGYGFIRFVTGEQAKNALSEFKDGIEVRGKLSEISASKDNKTLYISNIRKSWTKEKVCETLKGFGVHPEDIYLPDDLEKDGRIKGYAFMNFSDRSDTMEAFQRLTKPDAIFGCTRSAKVALVPAGNDEVLSLIKTVYVEGLPISWDDEKVKEICKQYGEIEKVKLYRNMKRKRKDFGFVTFTSPENALACVDGINSYRVGEQKIEVKANIAKSPQGRSQMKTRGGFKVETGQKEDISNAKSIEAEMGKVLTHNKGKASLNSERGGRVKSSKHQSDVFLEAKNGKLSKESRNRKRKNLPLKPGDRGTRAKDSVRRGRDVASERRDIGHGNSKRQTKKARGDIRVKLHSSDKAVYTSNSNGIRDRYTLRDDASASCYPGYAYGESSRSKRHNSDMEPHAGFLETAVVGRKQVKTHAHHHDLAVGTRDEYHASYIEPLVREPYRYDGILESHLGRQVRQHVDYIEQVPATSILPRARYLTPAITHQTPYPYEDDIRRVASSYPRHVIRDTDYTGGSDMQSTYPLNDTNYAGRQGGSAVGSYYETSRSAWAQLPRRSPYY